MIRMFVALGGLALFAPLPTLAQTDVEPTEATASEITTPETTVLQDDQPRDAPVSREILLQEAIAALDDVVTSEENQPQEAGPQDDQPQEVALSQESPSQEAAVAQDGQPKEAGKQEEKKDRERSEAATRVIDWIASTGDNQALPYIVVDKNAAAAFLFDADGTYLADAPVLIGVAVGDDATPGIGEKSLAEIGPAEKTTPAGRFLARLGWAGGGQRVLWVDYTTSVAMHPIPKGNPKEKRRERMLSPTADDNRITFGCINVPLAFYNKGIRPLFQGKSGGYVYVLPDTRALEDVFPPLHVQPFLTGAMH